MNPRKLPLPQENHTIRSLPAAAPSPRRGSSTGFGSLGSAAMAYPTDHDTLARTSADLTRTT